MDIQSFDQVKTGNFAEHSNQLWSISSVDSWIKICSGLVKKYQKEVSHAEMHTFICNFRC